MKKIFLLSMMCLMALSMQAQAISDDDYVDLGLPSGTLWKSKNEKGGLKTYDEAIAQFGNKLPTLEQWEELKGMCEWQWTGKGYKVIGDNGNFIILPAAGIRHCDGSVNYVGTSGNYWSSTPKDSNEAWMFLLHSDRYACVWDYGCRGLSVRLVQD